MVILRLNRFGMDAEVAEPVTVPLIVEVASFPPVLVLSAFAMLLSALVILLSVIIAVFLPLHSPL
ncbi:hypothetical protein CS006_00660 [Bifidobacterium primatium]|uniref:Uncharacterized protein n=1 Tax=Bifidobacterium primatium TaxID=2045438 RepID=A0A2M9HA94_9BIFI|nr:hypothetical protein CS006_00660 [Bifidobacterium primatium]